MVKNSFISVLTREEKEENKGSIQFQVFSFINKIRRVTSHLELYKKDFFITKRSTKNSEKTSMTAGLFVKDKCYKKLIGQLDIWEPKTR